MCFQTSARGSGLLLFCGSNALRKVTPMTLAVLETDDGGDDDATVFKRPEIRGHGSFLRPRRARALRIEQNEIVPRPQSS